MEELQSEKNVRKRLAIGFGFSLFCALVILAVSVYAIRSIRVSHTRVTERDTQDLVQAQKLLAAIERDSLYSRGFLLTQDEDFLAKSQEIQSVIDSYLREVRALTDTPKGSELLNRVETLLGQWRTRSAELKVRIRKIHQAKAVNYFEEELLPIGRRLRSTLDELIFHKEQKVHAAEQEANHTAHNATTLVVIIAGIALLLTGLLAFLVTRTITRLQKTVNASLMEEQRLNAELKRANQDLERFSSIASHDLQEPLRTISMFLSLLERRAKDSLDSESREYIHYAFDGAARLSALVSALLIFSRTGNWPLKPDKIASESILKKALFNLKKLIDENGATIKVGALPIIFGDQVQLTELFQNLIGNALKYRSDVPPRIEISARPTDGNWLFSIRDNGIGFDDSNADQIFEAFKRLHTRGEFPGTGLGLAVCKRIIERHGGKIWAESKPNEGSVFFFTLPQREGDLAEQRQGLGSQALPG